MTATETPWPEEPPDDWPTSIDELTPEALARVRAEVENLERSQAMSEAARHNWGGSRRPPAT